MTLPPGWIEAKLGEVGRWGSGGTPKASEQSFYGGEVPWIRSGDLPDGNIVGHEITISETGLANSSAKWVAEGSVLIAMYGATIGKLGISTYPVTTNQAIAFIEPADGVEVRYLFEHLRHRKPELVALGQGGAQPNISQEILKAQNFPLPPLPEQRRIVGKLAALTGRLARARAELDCVPLLTARCRRAAYRAAFITGGTPCRLAEITPSNAPIIYGILQPGPHIADGVPYVRPTEIQSGAIQVSQVRRTTPAIAAQYKRSTLRTGDLILTIVGTIGKVAEVPAILDGANITQSSCRIRVNEQIADRGYIRHWLQSPQAWQHYDAGKLGTAVPRLNLRDIREFQVVLPTLSEQARRASELDLAFARADRLEAEAGRARALIDRLEAAILAKAFRGELVPQDPSDEPASVLLDRIRVERAVARKLGRERRRKERADA